MPSALAVGAGGATTVAPWQLFFQQSNVVDKRITTRFLGYERADTALGTVLFAVGALRPPARSAWRTLGLVVLRCHLLAAIIILAVRAIQLALGSG